MSFKKSSFGRQRVKRVDRYAKPVRRVPFYKSLRAREGNTQIPEDPNTQGLEVPAGETDRRVLEELRRREGRIAN